MDIAGDDFPYGKIAVQMLFPTHGDVMTITAEKAEPAVLKSAFSGFADEQHRGSAQHAERQMNDRRFRFKDDTGMICVVNWNGATPTGKAIEADGKF